MSLEKSDTQITLSASAGFCRLNDRSGTNCLVFIDILDRAVMALPVCGPAPLRKLTFRTGKTQLVKFKKNKYKKKKEKIPAEDIPSRQCNTLVFKY